MVADSRLECAMERTTNANFPQELRYLRFVHILKLMRRAKLASNGMDMSAHMHSGSTYVLVHVCIYVRVFAHLSTRPHVCLYARLSAPLNVCLSQFIIQLPP